MARQTQKLTTKTVENKRKAGYYSDGAGLYLQVSSSGTKSWVFRFMLHGRRREMGLGSILATSLAEARAEAGRCRKLLQQQLDPIKERDEERRRRRLEDANSKTFHQCAQEFIKAHKAEWKNPKHGQQWQNSLDAYCDPVFRDMPVREIDTALVLRVLEPIWTTKAETATRLRGRIERVLDYARVRNYREGENPARWRGHLDHILAYVPKSARVQHLAALPFADMADFMPKLRGQEGVAPRALEFLILTATRTGDVRGARRSEVSADCAFWTIPGDRRKGRRGATADLRVPLCKRAAQIARAQLQSHEGTFLFPTPGSDEGLSENAMLEVVKRMGYSERCTPHGFRSTFRDWSAESTNYPNEVCEMALGHVIKNQAEAAYRRGELFEKRVHLMEDWGKFCEMPRRPASKVVPMKRATRAK